jgi:Cof subfamily protein (haloacid dehalogenase superfamily)
MIRLIAIDLDDTLLRSDNTISPVDKAALRRAIDGGMKVLLASGRMVQSMRPYAEELELDVPLIAYNGAIIQEARSGKILYHNPVSAELACELAPLFRAAGIHLNAYIGDELYMDELTDWGKLYAQNARVTPYPVGDLVCRLGQPSHKLLAVGPPEVIDAIQKELQSKFASRLQFIKSKPHYLEILAPGVSKGLALQTLAADWGIDSGEVLAIGDAPNDLSMIVWAGTGVAIGNACAVVKEAAAFTVTDHDHNGVAEALERTVFIPEGTKR